MRAIKTPYSTDSSKEKATEIVAWLDDKKARNILAFDLSGENSLTEAVVIATAASARHGQGLAEHVLKSARDCGYEFLRMEGTVAGQWILLDLNDVIVHIFQADMRDLFRLEDLWAKAPLLAAAGEKS